MVQYILAGVALGSIYAIASSGLLITYVSTGILNFSFGSMAYVVARFYYWLNTQHGMSTISAGLISLLIVAPLIGVILYAVLFRFLRTQSTLIKVTAAIGVSVALPPIADLTLGTQTVTTAPGLASPADNPFRFLGTPVTTDQVIIYGFLLFIVLAGAALLRFTDIGLRVRALVDSEAMTSMSGTHPGRVSLGVWAVSSTLAGLAGILVAPTTGLNTTGMTTLMATAFAALVVARLRSLPGVVVASLVMGIVTDVIQEYLPAESSLTAAIIPAIPFGFMLIALIYYLIRSGSLNEGTGAGGPLDQAIRPANQDPTAAADVAPGRSRWETGTGLIPLLVVAILPLIFRGSPYWLGLTALAFCYGITFLTYTLVTGEGGMIWLSQITMAGIGALSAAQFASAWHVPVLIAIVMGGVLAAVIGAVVGLLTIRLGDLYVALVTLMFGLLVETLVFTDNRFLQGGVGVTMNRPGFAQSDMSFAYLALAVFFIFAILTWNLRRSTTGLALRAVRDSEPAARSLGLSVIQAKVVVGGIGAFVAAVGGGFLALYQGAALPSSFPTFLGIVWLAVVVTFGIRSITGAALAGVAFALMPGVFAVYLPSRWAEVPTILFGLGALGVALHPEGAVTQNGRQIRQLIARLALRKGDDADGTVPSQVRGVASAAAPKASVLPGTSESTTKTEW